MSNLSIFESRTMWLSFASLDTLLLPLQVGHFGLQHYHGIGTDERLRNHGENFGFAPQHFFSICFEVC